MKNFDNYECDGQLSLVDIEYQSCLDCRRYKTDCFQERPEKGFCNRFKQAPKFYHKERCQNCAAWRPTQEQPPTGWGIKGWCAAHQQRTGDNSYCNKFEIEK